MDETIPAPDAARKAAKKPIRCPIHSSPKTGFGPFRLNVDCRLCWLMVNVYRTASTGRVEESPVCRHLGDVLPMFKMIPLNLSYAKVYRECEKGHGPQCRCDGKCGPACQDYEPDRLEFKEPTAPKVRRKHLAFHIFPSARNSVWRRAVDQLRMRWHLFDGVKAIAVCQGEGLDKVAVVADAFVGMNADVFPVDNNPGLREVATWRPLWDRVLSVAHDGDYAFYGHAKGTTRKVDPGCMTHRWASLLYSLNLDYWPMMEKLLARNAIVGAFKKTGYGFGKSLGRFHYSGTFYWVNIADFRRRYATSQPPNVWFGTECWPGMAYDVGEAGCIFGEAVQSKLDLYRPSYWASAVIPELWSWLGSL